VLLESDHPLQVFGPNLFGLWDLLLEMAGGVGNINRLNICIYVYIVIILFTAVVLLQQKMSNRKILFN
jgi:hypothetical protein